MHWTRAENVASEVGSLWETGAWRRDVESDEKCQRFLRRRSQALRHLLASRGTSWRTSRYTKSDIFQLITSAFVFVSSNIPIFRNNDVRVCFGKYTADDDFAPVVPECGICTIDRRRSIEKETRKDQRESLWKRHRSTTLHHVRVLLPALEKRTLAPKGVRRDAYVKQLQPSHCNRKRKQIFFFFFLDTDGSHICPFGLPTFEERGARTSRKLKKREIQRMLAS